MAKARSFDAAEYLDSPQAIADYVTEAFQTGDTDFILHAIGTVARAEGMAGIAQAAGLNREHLYRALSAGGHPELDTVMKVLGALGVQLAAAPKPEVRPHRRQARQHHAAGLRQREPA